MYGQRRPRRCRRASRRHDRRRSPVGGVAVEAAGWTRACTRLSPLHPTRANALTDEARPSSSSWLHIPGRATGETGMDNYWPGWLDGCAARPPKQRDASPAHRPGQEDRQAADDPQPRRRRRAVLERAAGRRRAADGDLPLFLVGRRDGADVRRRGWVLSLSGTVSFRNARALHEAAALIPGRTAARGDRCAVPDPASLPRGAERAVLPALHGARAGGRRGQDRR